MSIEARVAGIPIRHAMFVALALAALFASLVTRVAPAGAAITVTPAPNPPFPSKCGLNLALDFDPDHQWIPSPYPPL